MKKIITLLLLFSLNPAFAATSDEENSKERKLKLGIIVPLSGPLAFFGQDYVRAYDLAVEARPGLKDLFEVEWEDSAYDSKLAIAAFNKLTSGDGADVILSFGGPMLSVLAPIAESKKVPFFATESAKKDCENRAYCSLLRNEEDDWGRATWELLRKLGKKKIGIIKNQNQFMNTFVDAIANTKGDGESVEVLIDVLPDTTDLKTNVLPLRNTEIDTLGIYLLPGSYHGFLKAMRLVNKKFTLLGVEEFMVKENNRGFESYIEGARVIAPWSTSEYRNRFEKRYGHSAGFFYTPAFYDFLNLLGDTAESDKRIKGMKLVDALRFNGTRNGVSGKYSVKVSDKGVISYSFPIAVYKIESGGVVVEHVLEF